MAPKNRSLTVMLALLVTIMVGWVLYVGAGIIKPLVIALLLAGMLQPMVRWLARYRIPPGVTVVLLVIALFFGMFQLGVLLQREIASFTGGQPPQTVSLPVADDGQPAEERQADEDEPAEKEGPTEESSQPGDDAQAEVPVRRTGWQSVVEAIGERMRASALPETVVQATLPILENIDLRGIAAGLIGGGFGFTKALLLVMIYMIFFFAEQAVFRGKILAIAGSRREDAVAVLDRITHGIQRYLGVKTLVSAATAALCYAVLVALGIPYAELFGLLTFLLNYIPTFGSIIAAIFPAITALATDDTWTKAFVVAGAYLTINFLLGNLLEPKILGQQLNLSPLVIVISVVVWAGLWGVVGAFLAVPLTAAAQIILASQERTRPIAIMLSSGPPRDERRRKRPAAAV